MLIKKMAQAAQQERFAQILVPQTSIYMPQINFGRLIIGQDTYAVSYEDSGRKIPEWAKLRLDPHRSTDMYGTPCTSYMVNIISGESEPRLELDKLIRLYGEDELSFSAVHDVCHISQQNSANGKGRIIRAIKPNQVLYYSCNDLGMGISENLAVFHKALVSQLLRGRGGHESLHNFKHIVQVTRNGKRSEYRYELPADLPSEFLDKVHTIHVENAMYGKREIRATFTLHKHEPRIMPFRPRSLNDPKETGILSTYRHFAIHPEQEYLQRYLQSGKARLIHFDQPTTTCTEKCNMLNSEYASGATERLSLDRIVATYYFDSPNGYVVLVGPRLDDVIRSEHILAQIAGTEEIKRSDTLPKGMEHGTCTPFAYGSVTKDSIFKIVLLRLPEQLMNQNADYSIGGYGSSAHRASIQMTPCCAEEIIVSEFGKKVSIAQHPYQSFR
jgi:hypothetical protein